jgi:hypothetical protein
MQPQDAALLNEAAAGPVSVRVDDPAGRVGVRLAVTCRFAVLGCKGFSCWGAAADGQDPSVRDRDGGGWIAGRGAGVGLIAVDGGCRPRHRDITAEAA